MKMKSILLFILGLAVGVMAQTDLAKAMQMMQAGKAKEAIPLLSEISQKSWSSADGETATALWVEALLQTKDLSKANALAQRFLNAKPRSSYRDRMQTALAMTKVQLKDAVGAMNDLLMVLRYSGNKEALLRAKETALQILSSSLLNTQELTGLLEQETNDSELKSSMHFQLAKELQKEGRYKAASYQYRLVKQSAATAWSAKASEALQGLDGLGDGFPVVLVLAPLSGDYAELGNRLVQGVVLAHEEYSKANGKNKVLLQIMDDKADPVRALNLARQMVDQEKVIAIVGPMLSPGATALAGWLGSTHPEVALITPTATDEGIAALGTNVFQLNVSNPSLARAIAKHALTCLDARDFVVLHPVNDYGRIVTQAFVNTVEAGGGKVHMIQPYNEGEVEYKTEINRVRGFKLDLDFARKYAASGKDQSVSPKTKKSYLTDSLISYDAVFVATPDAQDAAVMVSHIAFNRLGGTLLGASGWYDKALFADGKKIVEGAFVSAPFADAPDRPAFQAFSKSFHERWKSVPDADRVNALSYDAMRWVLQSFAKGSGTVAQNMRSDKSLKGVLGDYQFVNGANISQNLFVIQKSQFVPFEGCNIPPMPKK